MTWIQSKNSRQLHHLLRLSWNQTNISINVERYTACQIWNPARCIQKRCKYLLRLWHTRLTYAHRGVFTVTHPVYAARILVSAYFGAGAATPARPTAPLNWSEILPAYMIKSIWRGKKKRTRPFMLSSSGTWCWSPSRTLHKASVRHHVAFAMMILSPQDYSRCVGGQTRSERLRGNAGYRLQSRSGAKCGAPCRTELNQIKTLYLIRIYFLARPGLKLIAPHIGVYAWLAPRRSGVWVEAAHSWPRNSGEYPLNSSSHWIVRPGVDYLHQLAGRTSLQTVSRAFTFVIMHLRGHSKCETRFLMAKHNKSVLVTLRRFCVEHLFGLFGRKAKLRYPMSVWLLFARRRVLSLP